MEEMEADLLVIGGGILGAGIALDAAARKLRTVLVEKADFASGTSSKSSKQIHGGLRYIEHLSLGLMRESIRERHVLTRVAPGLVCWSDFLLPYFEGKTRKRAYGLGLWLYDHLAQAPAHLKHMRLDSRQVVELCPEIREDGLAGGALFHDCITDDARLVLSVALDARDRGARIWNYTAVQELMRERNRAVGAIVRNSLTGECGRVRARQIVLAAGPWTDRVFEDLGEDALERKVRPAKGVHIVIRRDRLQVQQTILIPSARDARFLFVIPWYQGTIVGTTDTEYRDNPDLARPEREDWDYILDALNWAFPRNNFQAGDIVSSYAGVRPLINRPGMSTVDVPREHRIFESGSGIISVAGGKLTTYRRIASTVVDRVVRILRSRGSSLDTLPCWTNRIRLGNPPDGPFDPFRDLELPEDVRHHLVSDYGTWACQIADILQIYPAWHRRMAPGLPHILAEAYFSAVHERARKLEDVLARRTRVALLDPDQGRECAMDVCRVMAVALGWDEPGMKAQAADYKNSLRLNFPGGVERAGSP